MEKDSKHKIKNNIQDIKENIQDIKGNIQDIKENFHDITDKLKPENVEPHYFFTIANTISLMRAFLAIPIALLLIRDRVDWALILMGVAVVSDWLDGYAARKSNEVSTYGKALDPIADKVVAFAVLFVLVFKYDFPMWFILILTVRDFSITLLTTHLHNSRGLIIGANISGKIFIFFATVTGFLWLVDDLRLYAEYFLYFSTGLMILSWYFYIFNIIKTIKHSPLDPVVTKGKVD